MNTAPPNTPRMLERKRLIGEANGAIFAPVSTSFFNETNRNEVNRQRLIDNYVREGLKEFDQKQSAPK